MKTLTLHIKRLVWASCILLVAACGTPKEGCPGEAGVNYDKVDFTKMRKKKKAKSGLMSKKQRKRMRKKRGS